MAAPGHGLGKSAGGTCSGFFRPVFSSLKWAHSGACRGIWVPW